MSTLKNLAAVIYLVYVSFAYSMEQDCHAECKRSLEELKQHYENRLVKVDSGWWSRYNKDIAEHEFTISTLRSECMAKLQEAQKEISLLKRIQNTLSQELQQYKTALEQERAKNAALQTQIDQLEFCIIEQE